MVMKAVVVPIAAVTIVGITGLSYAGICVEHSKDYCTHQEVAHAEHNKEGATEKSQVSAEGKEAEEVGNTICPVSGEKIDEKTKVVYEYKGKIYAFCCQVCLEEFKKDPEKYIERMEKGRSDGGTQEQPPHKEHHTH